MDDKFNDDSDTDSYDGSDNDLDDIDDNEGRGNPSAVLIPSHIAHSLTNYVPKSRANTSTPVSIWRLFQLVSKVDQRGCVNQRKSKP